jgi:hypothetical protein
MAAQIKPRNRNTLNLLLDSASILTFLAVTSPHFTGMAIHEWLGVALGAALITHLLLHWSWLVAVTRRFFGTATWNARLNYFRQSSYGQALASSAHDQGAFSQTGVTAPGATAEIESSGVTSATASGVPASFSGRGPESHGPNLFAGVELLKNLAIIAASVMLVAAGTKMLRGGRRNETSPAPSEAF